ncbi:MAG: transcriptional regulator, partial [Oscillospiraceae bacterium]|nr:transcriptional regulator [Oscillospiraceae bacterium]
MSEDISHDNKDILFKFLSENYADKSFKVYGLDLPAVKSLLPTNLPAIKVDEKRSDNIFLLKDGSILIIEYESSRNNKNLLKYSHYCFRIAEKYYKKNLKIILVVIYTGNIKTAPNYLDFGSIRLQFEQVFLSKFNGQKMYEELKNKIDNNIDIEDEDILKFIILPLTQKKDRQKSIEESIELAKKIEDETKQVFVIAGIITAADKFIDKEYSKQIKEWIMLTKVARLFEEEKIDAVNKAVNETS